MLATLIRTLPVLALVTIAGPAAFPIAPLTVSASEHAEWIRPAALRVGDTIAFVAPAGPADAEKVAKAKERFEKMGFKVKVPPTLTARKDRYLAGSDEDRAAEFNAAIKDKTVQAVFSVKGGYGLTRILDRIDYTAIRENPKIIVGFSDLTALHLAVAKKCRVITFHAPMPQYGLYRDDEGFGYSSEVFWRTVRADQYPKGENGYTVALPQNGPKPQRLVAGKAKGRLVGGNLTLVGATMGTPYEIEAEGNILVLEDTGEKAYRIDRVLSQLKLAGLLDKFAGFVLGTFDGSDEKELDTVIREYFGHRKVPVITNFPIGHTPFNATLPHGGLIEIDADALTVRVLENPVTLDAKR
ncbi:Putative MccF-like protein (Microcin C7 resistance) OS=Singulisphaera acidiphila (strain ATCC BAA-1392 / DSM 18658 / VKM B-2454 / MOB10) GN=Sinac_3561 PE=4 SV=1: Peptidase_S66 [Gemmata massiliana]|uniref:LD-carboxypeptidase n=1 Tax=Gemmata massiliana TaxID=1210884 RepID=A0A6P2D1P9_9BACT|nr:LD-carboxypeptidase [Gemmata massiliana]VTR94506.1 Putative MccF-like protein (Microcin C7 resistance) OS=Singulisphaera acidiphila (strain ATCC BAA-1392 / DSM 18658 / VKM B-2454 / MOB10) GN=Sinac_3561 PE=4 SV=1: Peptidase_S66 [Gemmata massiliana]